MDIEIVSRLSGERLNKWRSLLEATELCASEIPERTALAWDGEELAATGSRDGAILKLIATSPTHRGEDLTASVLSALRGDAFDHGHRHLFLYTKPNNLATFSSLFFYPVTATDKVLVMESERDGISRFIDSLPKAEEGITGALVMNCDPFTLGHRYLIERASRECDRVYVMVLSEDGGMFSPEDRLNMVRLGVSDLDNVHVITTGPYLISSATFPTYFLKDRDSHTEAKCEIDIRIFTEYLVPRLGISRRYVGTEPLSPLTEAYNRALKQHLPSHGVELCEIPRLELSGKPVSASAVRKGITEGGSIDHLVPKTTADYLRQKGFI